jgi:hypothetical protein
MLIARIYTIQMQRPFATLGETLLWKTR